MIANRFTLARLTGVALSMVGALLLVTDLPFDDVAVVAFTTGLAGLACLILWCVAPLRRRARIRDRRSASGAPCRGRRRACADSVCDLTPALTPARYTGGECMVEEREMQIAKRQIVESLLARRDQRAIRADEQLPEVSGDLGSPLVFL